MVGIGKNIISKKRINAIDVENRVGNITIVMIVILKLKRRGDLMIFISSNSEEQAKELNILLILKKYEK